MNPTLTVDGVNYGEPDSPIVVVWSGPCCASKFTTFEGAYAEIERHRASGNSIAFQPRIYELDDGKTAWVEV
jgi:hypothetical protein